MGSDNAQRINARKTTICRHEYGIVEVTREITEVAFFKDLTVASGSSSIYTLQKKVLSSTYERGSTYAFRNVTFAAAAVP